MTKKQSFTVVTIVLLVLLGVRVLANAVFSFISSEAIYFFIIFLAIYLTCFLSVYFKQQWGSVMTLTVAALDLTIALVSIGLISWAELGGAIVADAVIGFLAYKEYESFTSKARPRQGRSKPETP